MAAGFGSGCCWSGAASEDEEDVVANVKGTTDIDDLVDGLLSKDEPPDTGWTLLVRVVVAGVLTVVVDGTDPAASLVWRSWYSWKQGTMHKFVWHSGQWYLVFLRKIRPCVSIVFQQKLQPSAGPGRTAGQWLDLGLSRENSRVCVWKKSRDE